MTKSVTAADRVARHYGSGSAIVDALLPATFSVPPRARIALMGPSGSGKSTLLHLLADLDVPSAGHLSWPALGATGTLRPQHIGMVFQTPSLLPMLSVIENVQVPLLLAGRAAEAPGLAARALASVGLAVLADKLPGELSGGQAQRVGIARAIAARPALLLADEPTGQLDHATGQAVFDALLAALDGTETALLVATHDPSVAGRLDHIWRMSHGQLSTEYQA